MRILGLSGRKQSGKDTTANYLIGRVMVERGLTKNFKITPQGKLYVYDLLEDVQLAGIFDYDSPGTLKFRQAYLDKYIKLYSFADCLKKNICIKMLGLTYEQCYGSDTEKNAPTHLKWEDMPGVVTSFDASTVLCEMSGDGSNPKWLESILPVIVHDPGFMTGREVMQYVGSDIFRRMYPDCHVNATINQIKEDNPEWAIVRDVRFPNEVVGINKAGGDVIRLLRDPNNGQDTHISETSLDGYDESNYLAVIDNSNMSIEVQNAVVHDLLSW